MRQFPPRQAQPSEVVLLFSLCVCVVVSVCVATVAKQDSSVNFIYIFFEHFGKKLSPCEATSRSTPRPLHFLISKNHRSRVPQLLASAFSPETSL